MRVIKYTIEQEGQQQIYRLITDLTDISLFPALVLAEQYHQRWEAENTLDEFKTHLNARKVPIRSKTPRLVVQEIYGWLLGHWAVRFLMFTAAHHSQISPLHLGFTGSLRLKRPRRPPTSAGITSRVAPFLSWLMHEILELKIPPREARSNPRVVKKPRSKFPAKKPQHQSSSNNLQQLSFIIHSTAQFLSEQFSSALAVTNAEEN